MLATHRNGQVLERVTPERDMVSQADTLRTGQTHASSAWDPSGAHSFPPVPIAVLPRYLRADNQKVAAAGACPTLSFGNNVFCGRTTASAAQDDGLHGIGDPSIPALLFDRRT